MPPSGETEPLAKSLREKHHSDFSPFPSVSIQDSLQRADTYVTGSEPDLSLSPFPTELS